MKKLGELYTDFSRIDLDTPGGYARVADVIAYQGDDNSIHRAFKVMRYDIDYQKGMERFEDELGILVEMSNDGDAPPAITRIYDSGFIPAELSQALDAQEIPDSNLAIISTGLDVKRFLREKSELQKDKDSQWLPYLVVDIASYDDSLFRQIQGQPGLDPTGLFRLPTGEVIVMAVQLLDVMNYLYQKHYRAYMDWKPEHIFWNGLTQKVKLIDWNVTIPLDDGPGKRQNIRDDLRIFCGAALYIGLTFTDPDDSSGQIGARPTTEFQSPVAQIRRRYWTDNPDFRQSDSSLSDEIKKIIRRGLDPKQGFDSTEELKTILLDYAQQELGLSEGEIALRIKPTSPYFLALSEVRLAQYQLLQAQQHLIEAAGLKGKTLEFTRLFDSVRRALTNFPAS
ncbi:MAG: hypothetical protein JNK26_05225 [Candidatus Doudnabacteria bacterium]|nr:hypothetical protein [Candidatus Doudnabacteria bacterium]